MAKNKGIGMVDLVGLAMRAVKDDKIDSFCFRKSVHQDQDMIVISMKDGIRQGIRGENVEDGIELLKSLYQEEEVVSMSVLIERIRQWFIDRNLHTANPQAQIAKLLEEAGELSKGVTRRDEDLIKDGIGDVVVVLIGLCTQLDLSFEECVSLAYNEIKDRKGKLIDGVFVKEEDL